MDVRSPVSEDLISLRSIGASLQPMDTRTENASLAPRQPKEDAKKQQIKDEAKDKAKDKAEDKAKDVAKKVAVKAATKAAEQVGGAVAAAAVPIVGELVEAAEAFEAIIEGVVGAIKQASKEDHEVRHRLYHFYTGQIEMLVTERVEVYHTYSLASYVEKPYVFLCCVSRISLMRGSSPCSPLELPGYH